MVEQYPHTLVVTTVPASSQDADGNWQTAASSTTELSCRAEPSSGNGFISGPDGEKIQYDWIIYMPLPVTTIAPGSAVEIKKGSVTIGKGKVKRFNTGQLNARAWI